MDSWYKVIDPNNPGPDHEHMAGAIGYSFITLARRDLRDSIETGNLKGFQSSLIELEKQYHKGKDVRNHYPVPCTEVNLVIPPGFLTAKYKPTAYGEAEARLRRAVVNHGDDAFLYTIFQITGVQTTGQGDKYKRPMITGQFKDAPSDLNQEFSIPPHMISVEDWAKVFNAFDYTLSHSEE